ncbi:MAG: endolytic transglycosylase MltG [Oscillospiraceae bacterium]|jgi:UPF0755 protein|nr:endolytic transglycosylase MltG [Oscillospiraceae bacterium]
MNNKNNFNEKGNLPNLKIEQYNGDTKPVPKLEDLKEMAARQTDAADEREILDGDFYEFYDEDEEPENYEPMITRRREKSTGIVGGLLYFLFVIGVSMVLACLLWMAASDVIALGKNMVEATIEVPALPYDRNDLESKLKAAIAARDAAAEEKEPGSSESLKKIEIPPNADVDTLLGMFTINGFKRPAPPFDIDALAEQLHDKDIIYYEWLFKLFAKLFHANEKIEPGVYTLDSSLDYHAIISSMRKTSVSRPIVSGVVIPEGYTCAQIFALLEEKNICSAEELWDAAANYEFDFSFIKELPKGDPNRLEGFLFPNTYDFYQGSYPQEAIKKFLVEFDRKYDDALRLATEEQGKTIKEVLTVASLIEREAANDDERPIIASVIYNRLSNWDNPILQIDASIQYALPEHKGNLSAADIALDSPYNSYLYPGLPPGPIANPGLASMVAALDPAKTEYYFYALNKEFVHKFFKTNKEHADFVAGPDFVNN